MWLCMNDNGDKNLFGLEACDFGVKRSKSSILFLEMICCDVAVLRTCCGVVAEILSVFPAIDAGCSDVAELRRG